MTPRSTRRRRCHKPSICFHNLLRNLLLHGQPSTWLQSRRCFLGLRLPCTSSGYCSVKRLRGSHSVTPRRSLRTQHPVRRLDLSILQNLLSIASRPELWRHLLYCWRPSFANTVLQRCSGILGVHNLREDDSVLCCNQRLMRAWLPRAGTTHFLRQLVHFSICACCLSLQPGLYKVGWCFLRPLQSTSAQVW